MKTITLFDICTEYNIPVVRYSANQETISRWIEEHKESNEGLRLVTCNDGYVYEEEDKPEYSAEFDGDQFIYSTSNDPEFHLHFLADILHHTFGLKRFTLYFYQWIDKDGDYHFKISGIY